MKLNDEMVFRACRVGNMAPRKAGHVPGGFSEGGRPADVAVGTFRSISFPPNGVRVRSQNSVTKLAYLMNSVRVDGRKNKSLRSLSRWVQSFLRRSPYNFPTDRYVAGDGMELPVPNQNLRNCRHTT